MSAKLYKPGDEVRGRRDLCVGKEYDGIFFTPGMKGYSEEIVTIKKVYPPELYEEDRFFSHHGYYHIKESFCSYSWTDEMFEPVTTLNISADEILDFLEG